MNPERLKYLAKIGDHEALKTLVATSPRYKPGFPKRGFLIAHDNIAWITYDPVFNKHRGLDSYRTSLGNGEGQGIYLNYGLSDGCGKGNGSMIGRLNTYRSGEGFEYWKSVVARHGHTRKLIGRVQAYES